MPIIDPTNQAKAKAAPRPPVAVPFIEKGKPSPVIIEDGYAKIPVPAWNMITERLREANLVNIILLSCATDYEGREFAVSFKEMEDAQKSNYDLSIRRDDESKEIIVGAYTKAEAQRLQEKADLKAAERAVAAEDEAVKKLVERATTTEAPDGKHA